MTNTEIYDKLKSAFGEKIGEWHEQTGSEYMKRMASYADVADPGYIRDICLYLRDEPELGFDSLLLLSASDNNDKTLSVTYHLEARDAIIPVVGNVSGTHALRAIGAAIAERHQRVSAFYISNIEFYLARDSAFGRFLDNLSRLPRDGRSVMIRSQFGRGSSVSVVQSIDGTIAEASRGR